MTTSSILVINSHRQILNTIVTPQMFPLKFIHSNILRNHHLSPPSLFTQLYPLRPFFCFTGTSGSWPPQFSQNPLSPLHDYPPSSTRGPHSALGPLVFINALFLNEHILAHIFVGKYTLTPDFVNFIT